MASVPAAWEGLVLNGGRYEVVEKIGEGGMGLIYRALDARLAIEVVIKVPRADVAADEDFQARFRREIRSQSQLSHPHIVKVMDVGLHDGLPYAVMQYLPGGDLRDRQQRDGYDLPAPMDVESLRSWLPGIASALDFMHGENFVHRDFKPPNILFDNQGNAYLSDFGIAKAFLQAANDFDETFATREGAVIGTPEYMAPEVILGHEYDGRADQYSLALVVYEMLSGRAPFASKSSAATLVKQVNEEPTVLHEANPVVGPAVSHVVHTAMSKDAAKRFATCADFAGALLDTARHQAPPPPPVLPRAERNTGTTPAFTTKRLEQARTLTAHGWKPLLLAAAVALLLVVGAAFAVAWLFREGNTHLITRDNVVSGEMVIDFNTRKPSALDQPAQDDYRVDLNVAIDDQSVTSYSGSIARLQRDGGAGIAVGQGELRFQLNVIRHQLSDSSEVMPGKSQPVGALSGDVPLVDNTYNFSHLTWTSMLGHTYPFAGTVSEETNVVDRIVTLQDSGNTVSFPAKESVSLTFHDLQIPADDAAAVGEVSVRGDLIYSRFSGSYFTENLVFDYGGESDFIQGTIVWLKDSNYLSNGKSELILNLVFTPRMSSAGAHSEQRYEEEQSLRVNDDMSSLTGVIRYTDEGPREVVDGEEVIIPHKSHVAFNLHANRLAARQVHTFLKAWLLMSGSVNDE